MTQVTFSQMSAPDWDFECEEIIRAVEYLKLEWPVHIKLSSAGAISLLGTHKWIRRDGKYSHVITVGRNQENADRASETIWHELRHARQKEFFGQKADTIADGLKMFREDYDLETAEKGYRDNSYEIDAREFARSKSDWKLTFAFE